MNDILIGGVTIGDGYPPFIIAEMSGNHNQSLEQALRIVDAAAEAGAHAIKLQTFTADSMTVDSAEPPFVVDKTNPLWEGKNLYELYQEAHTPWEWHPKIFDRAREKGILCFSSPFDAWAVDQLETLNAPAYKIASFENTDWPLLRKVAATGKPVIMSTGVATLPEIAESVDVLRTAGCKELILLRCTSAYPSNPEDANLRTIPHLRQAFGVHVGLSDHTMGIGVSLAAVALGARVVEKHFTISRDEGGVDAAFSLEVDEMKSLVTESDRAFRSLGQVSYTLSEKEVANRQFKRAIFVKRNIQAGEPVTLDSLKMLRPCIGIPAKHVDTVVQRNAGQDLKAGTALQWEHLVTR